LDVSGIWVHKSNKEVLEELACSLSKTYALRSLAIGFFGQVSFLHLIKSPPRLLRHLSVDGHGGELLDWVGSLTYLTRFDIMKAYLVDDQLFGILSNLPNLQNIWLGQDAYVGPELVARSSHNFPVQYHCTNMHLVRFEKGSMDKLEELTVNFSFDQRSLIGIEHLPNLKEVEVFSNKTNS
jgi:disease resistance protein RPM1